MASPLDAPLKPIDWKMCCLCQSKKPQALQNATEKGINSLERDLKDLDQLEALPFGIDLRRLDDGTGISSTLVSNKSVYHKACRSACNSIHVKRVRDTHDIDGVGSAETDICSPKKLRSSIPSTSSTQQSVCVVCDNASGELHKVLSMDAGKHLTEWAAETKNFLLHARLVTTAADAHAGDIFYHRTCYTQLRYDASKARQSADSTSAGQTNPVFDPMVTAQLCLYMAESGKVFKRTYLESLYKEKLKELGKPSPNINPTRFKDHLLNNLPDGWHSFTKGRDVFLSHSDTVGEALAQTCEQSEINQDDALLLMKASTILRKHILMKQDPFTGSFTASCLTGPVPEPLLSFMMVLLQGPKANIEGCGRSQDGDADMHQRSKVACGLCQLIMFNAVKQGSTSVGTTNIRHSKDRETPIPLYVGIKMHSSARLKHLVGAFHQLGLSVSYDRVREVKLAVARSVCKRIEEDGVVLPTNMRSNVFTTGDMDNLDHKKTSNLSNDEFHGMAVTLTNHLSAENMGVTREPVKIDSTDTSTPKLPDHYVIVPPVDLRNEDLFVPRRQGDGAVRPSHDKIPDAIRRDEAWITHVGGHLSQEEQDKSEVVTWSGFHSTLLDETSVKPPAEIGILPLFPDKSTDPGLIKHVMLIVKKSTEFLNPGQTPVLGADQPLYAIAKQLQWQFPAILGENMYVLMMGALHIEEKAHLMLGKFIRGSGWEWVMTTAEVFTAGRAASTLDDHHIKRTRYAHQTSLVALSLLKKEAYLSYCEEIQGQPEPFELWDAKRREDTTMFKYWSQIMELELLMCRFVRSLREGDFDLYVQVLDELCPWFFAFDHTNYARWLPIHVKDLVELPIKHPDVYAEFKDGNFVVQRSCHKFSLIAKDQSHEQSNKKLQAGGGGLSDMYDDAGSLALYMMSGPDSVRIIDEFESVQTVRDSSIAHHEESPALQQRFITDVKKFMGILKDRGNPFLETGHELVAIDTNDVMEHEVAMSLSHIEEVGKSHHDSFVNSRVSNASVALSDTIKRNGAYTFANRPDTRSKKAEKIGVLKKDVALVTQLFLSLQSRPDADMSDFFRFENQREPPSLADRGSLRSGTKSDILKCLGVPTTACTAARDVTIMVLDMPALVHIVRPSRAATFDDYVSMHLIPYLKGMLTPSVSRVDAVWDVYPDKSLKMQAHLRRGTGPRTRIAQDGSTPIPKRDWQKYLSNTENKKDLFSFCSQKLAQNAMNGILLVTTASESALANQNATDMSGLQPCNHSEADTRIILHLADASRHGHDQAYVRTVDSDIVVLAIAFFEELHFSKLWVGFGSGKNYKDIPIHELHATLGPSRSRSLPLFHALSGCDTTSQLLGCGKKTAWAAWNSMPEITETFLALTNDPHSFKIESVHMQRLERFHIIMYSKSCSAARVDQARQQLFSRGLRSLEAIPPTQAALFEHVKRSILQACIIWKQAGTCHQEVPNYASWGWELDEKSKQWIPFWTMLADASKACAVLLHCGCQKACRGLCKCSKAGVRCTSLCKCEGGCANNENGDQ